MQNMVRYAEYAEYEEYLEYAVFIIILVQQGGNNQNTRGGVLEIGHVT